MIIHQVKLVNFGVYEEQVFDLKPEPCNGFNRPIVLLRGKNGAGKTTLIQAIRLCLHGSLALGSRVSRAAYEGHLAKRIHLPPENVDRPTTAKIELVMDYVSEGKKRKYRVERSWEIVNGGIQESVRIWEDDNEQTDLETRKEKDSFLRELVHPGLADLFFFDGEKLDTLAQSETAGALLADTVKALLGIHLVEQLQTDLDVYLARQGNHDGQSSLESQLLELTRTISDLEREQSDLLNDQHATEEEIAQTRHLIAAQEQKIASQGNWFAERLGELKERRQSLELEIDFLRRKAQDMANGLLPFAVTPKMCQSVLERLRLEAQLKQVEAGQKVLADQLEAVSQEFRSPDFWKDIGVDPDDVVRHKALTRVESALKSAIQRPDVSPKDVILHVSEEERSTLSEWIKQTQTSVPRAFCEVIAQLDRKESELRQILDEMQLVPPDETLAPLVQELNRQNQELGRLMMNEQNLVEQIEHLKSRLEQLENQRRNLRDKIAKRDRDNDRVQMVNRAQTVLEEYAGALAREKTARLEKTLVRRFNDLSRKENLLDGVTINPETFKITLQRQDQPFPLSRLSAGERQIFAMAIMWALREVSGLPMPVVIDAPLGRLDSAHRLSTIRRYFPRVSHQVILLVTDTEIDERVTPLIKPATSHIYDLDYDQTEGKTVARKREIPCVDARVGR
jgi:DNA sulfur modification protein DndD